MEPTEPTQHEPTEEQLEQTPRVLDTPAADFVPTSAEGWSFEGPWAAILPSGNKVLLRKPDLLGMLQQGEVPNPLMEYVQRLFADEDMADLEAEAEQRGVDVVELLAEKAEAGELDDEAKRAAAREQKAPEWIDFVHLLVWAALQQPEVSFDPPEAGTMRTADGRLSIRALSDADKMFVFEWASRRVVTFAGFPGVGTSGSGGRNGGEVREDADRVAGGPTDP